MTRPEVNKLAQVLDPGAVRIARSHEAFARRDAEPILIDARRDFARALKTNKAARRPFACARQTSQWLRMRCATKASAARNSAVLPARWLIRPKNVRMKAIAAT